MTDNNPPAASSGARYEPAGRHAAPECRAPDSAAVLIAGKGRHRAVPPPVADPITRPATSKHPQNRRRQLVGGAVAAALAAGLGVAIIAAVAAEEPRALPPPPNNPGVAGYSPATVVLPVQDTLPVGPAAPTVVVATGQRGPAATAITTVSSLPSPAATAVGVTSAQPSRSTAATTFGGPVGAPASVTTLGSDDPGFGWPSSAFGADPPVGAG